MDTQEEAKGLYERWLGMAYVDGELPSAGALPDWEGLPEQVKAEWVNVVETTEKAIRASMKLIPWETIATWQRGPRNAE